MYRVLQTEKCEKFPLIFRLLSRHCQICNQTFQQTSSFHLSFSQRVQYKAALKYLLQKKTKKQKKKFVEVVCGTEQSLKNVRASVDVMRGKQLSALTTQLTARNKPLILSRYSNFSTSFLQSNECLRHYDPLLVLPATSQQVDPNSGTGSSVGEQTEIRPKKDDQRERIIQPLLAAKIMQDRFELLKVSASTIKSKSSVVASSHASVKIKDLAALRDDPPKPIPQTSKKQILLLKKKLRIPVGKKDVSKFDNPEEDADASNRVTEERATSKASGQRKNVVGHRIHLKKSTKEAIAHNKISDLNRMKKQESLNANFLSFADVCVNSDLVNDAFIAVKVYRRKCEESSSSNNPNISDIEVYNTIMSGYAKLGNWSKIRKLMAFAEADGVSYNAQTFAAILECLSHKLDSEAINTQLLAMDSRNIAVNDVLVSTKLNVSSYDNVLKAILFVMPDFSVQPPNLKLNYDCLLLNHLSGASRSLSSPVPPTLDSKSIQSFYTEQIQIEKENYVEIETVEKRSEELDSILIYRQTLDETKRQWKETIEEAFDRDLNLLKQQGNQKPHFYFTILPYLLCIPKQDHVDIIMHEIRKLAEGSETYSPTTKQLYRELGTQVFLRYQIKKKSESGTLGDLNKLFAEYSKWYVEPDDSAANTRQKWQLLLHQHSATNNLCSNDIYWKNHVLIGVGHFLYNIIIRDVKIDVNIFRKKNSKEHFLPAFYTLFRTKGTSSKEQVKPHPTLSRLFRVAAPEHLVFEASKIPMVCPPIPWTTITSGGYLLTKTDLIRLPYQAIAQWKALEATPVNQLYPAFDSLNQLGAVPWTVNEEVLDVVLEVFRSGGSDELDVPRPAALCPTAPPVNAEMTPQEKGQVFRQRIALRRKRAEMYSLWCDALYKLSLAHHFRKKTFWLPHNMDFRGRVYPVAPHLNHLGSDLSRSLLVFAKGQPLGPEGFDWLKIHTINLTGTHKKKSMQERLEYANLILDEIIDSANNPLTGRMWWKESEEPWQTLAACIEVRNAIACGDPAGYVSRFPVHQDGSCNGLQHYAALGRDQAGGESVNLTPAAVPQDVYSCVAAIVERERAKDAANGIAIAQHLEGFIQRKVIKQTVMTTVYGVTKFGARLQIARQLKDLNKFPKQYVWQASMYLVNKTFDSLQEMFTSTKEIQDWFTECARLIAQVSGENVQWITPLGLPIVQPYSKSSTSYSPSNFKFIGAQASDLSDAFERPNVMKQKNAFAPNFVHSLDSSHMMLTSIECERLGVTFVSVHDCYWTHACTVPIMNSVCRSQFVALHSHPVLPNLSDFFVKTFSYPEAGFSNDGSSGDMAKRNLNRTLSNLPTTGELDLEAVLRSPYFFS